MKVPSQEELSKLKEKIQSGFHYSLLNPKYAKNWSKENPTYGFCSIASEAAWFLLGGKEAGWVAMAVRESSELTHWWLRHDSGIIFDPTVEQYTSQNKLPPYERGLVGKPCGFMGIRKQKSPWSTKYKPSKRAKLLLERIENQEISKNFKFKP